MADFVNQALIEQQLRQLNEEMLTVITAVGRSSLQASLPLFLRFS